jgi:integrase
VRGAHGARRTRNALQRTCRRFPDCTPHDFRHSYGTMLIFAGVNPKAVCAFMGHANITVTFDIYGHILPGSEAQAVALQDTYIVVDLARGIEAPATRSVA